MDKAIAKQFGQVLRKLRMERDFSQEGLALECGLDRTFISMLERGVRQPTLTTMVQLKKALRVSLVDMVELVEKQRL